MNTTYDFGTITFPREILQGTAVIVIEIRKFSVSQISRLPGKPQPIKSR